MVVLLMELGSNIVDTIKMRKNGWLSKHYVLEVKDLGRVFSFLNN